MATAESWQVGWKWSSYPIDLDAGLISHQSSVINCTHIQSISTPTSPRIAPVLLRSSSLQKRSSKGSAMPPSVGLAL